MRRGALHYILVGAALGLGVPLVFRLASITLELYAGMPASVWTVFDYVQLMLWPTPLLLVPVEEPGAPDLSSGGAFAVATLANITVYAVLAGLIWTGLTKSRLILAFPVLIVAAIWYAVWRNLCTLTVRPTATGEKRRPPVAHLPRPRGAATLGNKSASADFHFRPYNPCDLRYHVPIG